MTGKQYIALFFVVTLGVLAALAIYSLIAARIVNAKLQAASQSPIISLLSNLTGK